MSVDHDQRFKLLIKEFFREFMTLFFPKRAARLSFGEVVWLEQELFLDPPQGPRRVIDLIARLDYLGKTDDGPAMVAIHIEIEADSLSVGWQQRMFRYNQHVRLKTNQDVLSIGLYLKTGYEGIGWETYTEGTRLDEEPLLTFRFPYIGLPALDGEKYLTGDNLLGIALASSMRLPPDRRLELMAGGLKTISVDKNNSDYRKFLAAECLEAYLGLDDEDMARFNRMVQTEPQYEGVRTIMKTSREQGLEEGLEKGLRQGLEIGREEGLEKGREEGLEKGREEGMRETLAVMVAKRLHADADSIRAQMANLHGTELLKLFDRAIDAKSLAELGLKP